MRNVAKLVKTPTLATTRKPMFLDVTEAKALLAGAAADAFYGDAVALILLVGLRRGEVLGLRWRGVHLDADPPTLPVVQQLSGPRTSSAPRTKATWPRRACRSRPRDRSSAMCRWR